MGSTTRQDGNGDHGADEEDIEENSEEGEEGQAAKEDGQDDGKTSVNDRTPGHAFHCLHPSRYAGIAVGED